MRALKRPGPEFRLPRVRGEFQERNREETKQEDLERVQREDEAPAAWLQELGETIRDPLGREDE